MNEKLTVVGTIGLIKPQLSFHAGSTGYGCVLIVSPDGEFTWHEDADRILVDEAMFVDNMSILHVLRRLRESEKTA